MPFSARDNSARLVRDMRELGRAECIRSAQEDCVDRPQLLILIVVGHARLETIRDRGGKRVYGTGACVSTYRGVCACWRGLCWPPSCWPAPPASPFHPFSPFFAAFSVQFFTPPPPHHFTGKGRVSLIFSNDLLGATMSFLGLLARLGQPLGRHAHPVLHPTPTTPARPSPPFPP